MPEPVVEPPTAKLAAAETAAAKAAAKAAAANALELDEAPAPVEAAPVEAAPVQAAAPVAAAPAPVPPIIVTPVVAAGPWAAPAAVPAVAGPKAPGAIRFGGLLVLLGGLAAAASAFLPMLIIGDSMTNPDNWVTLWHPESWDLSVFTEPNGAYLLGAGLVAALCGLLLFVGMVRGIPARFLLALAAVAAAVIILAFHYADYGRASALVDQAGASPFADLTTMGFGLYVGIAGGVAIILGSLTALASRK
jgi:hypothetical protein